MTKTRESGFGIYLHWPFCLSKCPYCDFNSHVTASVDVAQWLAAFLRALERFAERTPGRTVSSVFFGGGTPSLIPPELAGALLERIATLWTVAADAEITLEANPTSSEAGRFRDMAAAGINRLSLGIQALDDTALRLLGRTHTVADALAAWKAARRCFPRASFDLIYGRPGQKPADWEEELERALALEPTHLSAYQLTMEPETPFFRLHARGRLILPNEKDSLAMFRITEQMTEAAGLLRYEVSNHAVPGEECRHNLLYWHYEEYAGIGPGAHSRLISPEGRFALRAFRAPDRWLATADTGGLEEETLLAPCEQAAEYLLMALRTREGADPERLTALGDGLLPEGRIHMLVQEGLLCRRESGHIAVTPQGMPVLDRIVLELL